MFKTNLEYKIHKIQNVVFSKCIPQNIFKNETLCYSCSYPIGQRPKRRVSLFKQ